MPVKLKPSLPVAFGPKLKQARRAMGLTLKQVSENMGLAVSTISEIESEKRRLSVVELNRFAKLYHRPVTFFFEKEESSASLAVLLRAADAFSVDKDTIIEFHELCRSYRDLRKLVGAPEMPGPPDYSSSGLTTFDQAEELAEVERSVLGLNGQPVRDIYDLLEGKRGIKIFHLPESSETLSGAFACDEEIGSCFLINSCHPQRRRTFTVAHEYAHCIVHRNQLAHIDAYTGFETKNPRERFANAFAAAFLMPRRTVSEVLSQLVSQRTNAMSAEVVLHLAMYFGVSFEAAGWRLVSLRKLPVSIWEDLRGEQIALSPTARLLGYSNEVGKPDTLPRQYRYLAYEAYKMKLISFERLAELLRRNYYELREEFSYEKQGQ